MHFDIATAMTTTSLLTFCVGASLTFAASRYPVDLRDTMRIWIGGLFLQALALFVPVLLRSSPTAAMIVLSNAVYALAYAEMGRALHAFTGRPRSWVPALLVAAVAVNSFLFGSVWPSERWRIALNAPLLAGLQSAVAWAILRHRTTLRPADYLTAGLFVACAVLALARGSIELIGPALIAPGMYTAASQVVFVFSSILPMIGTVGFMLMCGDRLNNDLARLAMVDPLTGVYNRRHMQEVLEHHARLVHRQGGGFAIALLDMDHFKRINDEHGHACGDAVLYVSPDDPRELADLLLRVTADEALCERLRERGRARTAQLTWRATAVKLLYLALNWLIVEQLTLPDVFTPAERDRLVTAAVDRIVAAG